MDWLLLLLILFGAVLGFFGYAIVRRRQSRRPGTGLIDAKLVLAATIVLCTGAIIWTFRYEHYGYESSFHRNRVTGVVCYANQECWISSEQGLK